MKKHRKVSGLVTGSKAQCSLSPTLDTCSYGKLLILLYQYEGLESLFQEECSKRQTEIVLEHRQLDFGTKGVVETAQVHHHQQLGVGTKRQLERARGSPRLLPTINTQYSPTLRVRSDI